MFLIEGISFCFQLVNNGDHMREWWENMHLLLMGFALGTNEQNELIWINKLVILKPLLLVLDEMILTPPARQQLFYLFL